MRTALQSRHWKLLQWLLQHARHDRPARITDRARSAIELLVAWDYVLVDHGRTKVLGVSIPGRRALGERHIFEHYYRCPYCGNRDAHPGRGVLNRVELLSVDDDGWLNVGCRDCGTSFHSCHPDLYSLLPTPRPALERARLLSKAESS